MNIETIRTNVCQHRQLARQCPLCERDIEISRLVAEIEQLRDSLFEAVEFIEQETYTVRECHSVNGVIDEPEVAAYVEQWENWIERTREVFLTKRGMT